MAASTTTGKKPTRGVYVPTQTQLLNQKQDRSNIDRDLRYRGRFERKWLSNVEKWNQVAPEGMEGVPNYVVPISRMATQTGVVSMRQNLPDVVPVPEGSDEKKLSYLLREASAHVHRMSNMEGVLDQGIVDYAVIGNMVLESYVKIPFKCRRVPKLDAKGKEIKGEFEKIYVRDWSKPKIGTRARSPWECAFDSGARIPSQIRRCWFQDRMSLAEFEEQFKNKPENDYINLDLVEPGYAWTFNNNGDLERQELPHDAICIDNVQNELDDSWRIYAQGILIWDVPLSSVHAHGKCTLSLIPNHHRYDSNKKTHALYGTGDPELIEDLDDLINAATNMFILNYQNKNTIVPSIEGGAVDAGEIDFTSGQPIAGKITLQSLGQADLPEWAAFKDNLEEWAIQAVKKNYRRLEGEVAKTAYEAAQKKSDENKGMEYQIKRMEAGGMLEYAKKHISDIMEHLPVEEWEDILDSDQDMIRELMKAGDLTRKDVVYRKTNGKLVPVRVRYTERIKTRGKVFKEKMSKSGERDLEGLTEIKEMRGQDGWLPASSTYLHTRSWRLFKRVPDVYLVGKTILGQDDLMELGKIEQLLAIMERIAGLQQQSFFENNGLDAERLIEKSMDAIDIRKEEITKSAGEQKTAQIQQNIKRIKDMAPSLFTPRPNVQAPVQGGTPQPGSAPAPQAAQAGNPLDAAQPVGG